VFGSCCLNLIDTYVNNLECTLMKFLAWELVSVYNLNRILMTFFVWGFWSTLANLATVTSWCMSGSVCGLFSLARINFMVALMKPNCQSFSHTDSTRDAKPFCTSPHSCLKPMKCPWSSRLPCTTPFSSGKCPDVHTLI